MAASFSLIIEDDAGKQIVVPFAKDVITIGRKEGNTIRLTERNVSRFHARLSKESNHVVVEDLTSFNGVKLNGDRIAGRVEVGAGDVIEIGDYHLELRTSQPSATTQKMGPAGARSAGIDHAPQAEDDEFEGDTQRWEQPAGGPALVPVGVMPTVEEHVGPLGSFGGEGDTEKLDLDKLSAMVAAGQSAPPPAPLTPAQSWPPPPRSASPSLPATDLEATVRQPVAAPPAPPSLSPAFSPPSAPAAPFVSASAAASEDDTDATQDMPLPAVAQARANLLAQGVGVRREPVAVEQTEQMRIAPSLQIADELALPRLVVLNTIFSGSTFPLRAMENVLGRTDDNDIVLEHRSVSRNHAKLVREGERVRILDLKSANGVLVNGEEVEQHVLKSGDVIELGRVRIRFVPVGERFAVAADEVERARIADANGDDADDSSGLTSNGTSLPRGADGLVAAKKPIALYAILAVLVIMVVVLGAIVMSGKDTPAVEAPSPTVPTTVGAIDTATVPATAVEADAPAVDTAAAELAAKPAQKDTVEVAVDAPQERVAPKERDKPKEAAVVAPAPVDNEKQFEEARRALFSNDAARGVKMLDELVKKNPREPRFQLALAAGYKQLGQIVKARQHYEAFLGLQHSGADAEKVRGLLKDLR